MFSKGLLLEHTKKGICHTIHFLTEFLKMSNFLVFQYTKNGIEHTKSDLARKKGHLTHKN